MTKTIKVQMNGKTLTATAGASIEELLPRAPHQGKFAPLAAVMDNRLVGLYYRIKSPATIETIDLSNRQGMDIYRRTVSTILYAAMLDIAPHSRVVVGQSISDGYFFEIHGQKVDREFLTMLDQRMREIVKADLPLLADWTTVEEAMAIFKKYATPEKVKMLEQLRRSEIPMLSLENYRGYAHGPVAARTGLTNIFQVYSYEHGIVLDFPNDKGQPTGKIVPQPKLFNTYLETKRWNELAGIKDVADLNELCMKGRAAEMVMVTEALHDKKIAAIADDIAKHRKAKLILIAGPSSSGKTTFAKKLGIHLKVHGIEPVGISIDNYYIDREKTPKHPDGSYNFECLEALDIELFNEHIDMLIQGEEVDTPFFSFPLGKRVANKFKRMKLKKDQVLVTEGIHGLNEALTPAIPTDRKFKIYVSALTQLCLDDNNRIFTSDTRLCRRIVRDRLFRGTSAAESIAGWSSVRAGEAKYIFPFQEEADVIFNSAMPYEHALLKPYAERFLTEVPRHDASFIEASRLARFFSFFIPILGHEVPRTSILREFIGGSAFSYT